jgi:sulfate/thiosulfate transport system substrate-binding protein
MAHSPRARFGILVFFALAALTAIGCGSSGTSTPTVAIGTGSQPPADTTPIELLNVSYDPTRELWQDLNAQFAKQYEQKTGRPISIKQSHGGSSSQARAVNDGLEADVVTLGLWADTDLLRRGGLIAEGWEERLPEHSLPYYSTIAFVVRKGNPKNIHDWPDLVKSDIQIITPNPKTSGNGKWSYLAAWGSVVTRGGSEEEAKKFITKLYQQVPVLDTGARGATITFSKKNIGDVHLTWENEAQLEVLESKGELELVYPLTSIRAEPYVAWVDQYVKKHGTADAAKAYLEFLYTPAAQETIAKHYYRPNAKDSRAQFADKLPTINLFEISAISKGWDDANERFFNDGGLFDQIYQK